MVDASMTASYVIAIILGLLAGYFADKMVPTMNPFIKFLIVPFLVIYVLLLLFRIIFPGINRFGQKFKDYVDENAANDIHAMSYVEIFPPIFVIFLIIVVLLYSGIFK